MKLEFDITESNIQGHSLTVTPLTVTVGNSDTFIDSQTITNGFQAVTVTNMWLQ